MEIKNFEIGGRLADYAYYDMDMTISAALKLFENKILVNKWKYIVLMIV